MRVTPLDIQQKRFHLGLRGYSRREVDEFLDLVREEMEDLVRELTELREFHHSYQERLEALRQQEDNLKNTMLMTQKLVEDLKESARKEASLIVKDAEVHCHKANNEALREKVKLEADIQNLHRQRHHFIQDVKKVIQMHLEMLSYEEEGEEVRDVSPAKP